MKTIIVNIWLFGLTLSLVACGGAATPSPQPVTVTVAMSEYAFNPNNLDLKVGQQVTLELVNNGQLQHEIIFGREVMTMDNRPAGYQVDMFEAGGVEPEINIVEEGQMTEEEEEEHAGIMVVLGIGGRATMSFTVTEGMLGEWEMGCFEQEGVHYDAGMHGPVTVTR